MTNIINVNLLHVSTPDCHPQEIFQIKGMQAQHAIRSMHGPH